MKTNSLVNEHFYQELRQLSYQDEMRPKLLIYGIKRILKQKQKRTFLQKILRSKIQTQPISWQD